MICTYKNINKNICICICEYKCITYINADDVFAYMNISVSHI